MHSSGMVKWVQALHSFIDKHNCFLLDAVWLYETNLDVAVFLTITYRKKRNEPL